MRPSTGFYLAAGLAAFDAAVAARYSNSTAAAGNSTAAPGAAHDKGIMILNICHEHASSRDHVGLVQECIHGLDRRDPWDVLRARGLHVGRCECLYVSDTQGAWPQARDFVLEDLIAKDETCRDGGYLKVHKDGRVTRLTFSCEEE